MAQKAKIAAKSPQKTGSKLTQKRPDEGLYIDARIGSSINNLKKFIKMATISIEFGKESSQKTREVYLLVRQGKTKQRVKTGVRLNEQEYSPKTKKIKSIEKARIVEKLRLDLIDIARAPYSIGNQSPHFNT